MEPEDPIALAHRNWVDAGWADAADGMAFVTSVVDAQRALGTVIDAVLRPHRLTFARFEVLRLLAFTRRGELPVGKIGERLQVHPASVTSAVGRLEEAGLVRRNPNPDDGRGVLAVITDEGRELVERCTVQLNHEVFGALPVDSDDLRRIVEVLAALRRSVRFPE